MIGNTYDYGFGSKLLSEIGDMCYADYSESEQYMLFKMYQKVKNHIKNEDDWIINFLCSYDKRTKLEFGDLSWIYHIYRLINQSKLYLTLLPFDHWALPDNEKNTMYKNIMSRYSYIDIYNTDGTSDGTFTLKHPIEFAKVYRTDEETPENPEILKYNEICGLIEFGTTPVCKSVQQLLKNNILLRLPYSNGNLSPLIAIFLNIEINYE